MNNRSRGLVSVASVVALALYQIPLGYSRFAGAQRAVTSGSAAIPPGSPKPTAGDYEDAVKPLILHNCVGCHNPSNLRGTSTFSNSSASPPIKR